MACAPVVVAVISWNTRDLLRRCLESFAREVDSGRVELWVVDNASDDGSADLVREEFGWTRLIASEENLGFGRAVNLVASRTSSDWIAPANADIALREGAIDALVEAGERDRSVGAIAPRLIGPDGETQHSVFSFPTIPYSVLVAVGAYKLIPSLGDRIVIPGYWDSERARQVPWAIAAFLLIRRVAWDAVGGFDARQWMYAEDLDLGWRLRGAGWKTRYEPRAVIDHVGGAATTQMFGSDPSPQWQRATYGSIARRSGVGRAWLTALIHLAGAGLRWCYFACASITGAERYVRRRRESARWAMVQLRALRMRRGLRHLG